MGKIKDKIRLLKGFKLLEFLLIIPLLLVFPRTVFNSLDFESIFEILRAG